VTRSFVCRPRLTDFNADARLDSNGGPRGNKASMATRVSCSSRPHGQIAGAWVGRDRLTAQGGRFDPISSDQRCVHLLPAPWMEAADPIEVAVAGCQVDFGTGGLGDLEGSRED
jgi:hypothetical protein